MDFVTFIFNIVILLPLWFCTLLPFTIIFFVYTKLCNCGGARISTRKSEPNETIIQSIRPKKTRKFDVIVYGATGFTGN